MDIDDSEFESRRHEIVGELRSSIRQRVKRVMDYWWRYLGHRKASNLVLSGILKTVAAGLFLVVLLPDKIGWRPFYALVVAMVCSLFAIKFRVDGKE